MRRFVYQYFARTSRFRHDIGGAAAIEFAFIVPLMVVMFIGTVELSQAITVDRRVNQVASSTGDLVARTNALTTSEMSAIMGETLRQHTVEADRVERRSVAERCHSDNRVLVLRPQRGHGKLSQEFPLCVALGRRCSR
jgi:Flp pilus assembly pilin Flp